VKVVDDMGKEHKLFLVVDVIVPSEFVPFGLASSDPVQEAAHA